LDSATERLYLLRQWVRQNREREDALDVVEFGLQTIISATDYAPNARVYRELALALPHATDLTRVRELALQRLNAPEGREISNLR
jgi:hypothetical protein